MLGLELGDDRSELVGEEAAELLGVLGASAGAARHVRACWPAQPPQPLVQRNYGNAEVSM